jgi:protein tyrosine phosphatase (PTP) superfamily phosphohydrolase (DUF442 family)
MKRRRLAALLAAGLVLVAGSVFAFLEYEGIHVLDIMTARQATPLPEEVAPGPPSPEGLRPAAWAQPIELPGAPNLHKVSDDLYRGAQPTAEGLAALRKMGIKTVINLQVMHSDPAKTSDGPLTIVNIPVEAWSLGYADIAQFLHIVSDKKSTPVFVHCQHGADRTGTMCAAYRIVIQGWTKDEAIREMTRGGFGYHVGWGNLPVLIDRLDVDAIRKRAGLPTLP